MGEDKYEITIYSSCVNTDKGIYYYKTYDNSQISAVDMYKENLDSDKLINYDLIKDGQILYFASPLLSGFKFNHTVLSTS